MFLSLFQPKKEYHFGEGAGKEGGEGLKISDAPLGKELSKIFGDLQAWGRVVVGHEGSVLWIGIRIPKGQVVVTPVVGVFEDGVEVWFDG